MSFHSGSMEPAVLLVGEASCYLFTRISLPFIFSYLPKKNTSDQHLLSAAPSAAATSTGSGPDLTVTAEVLYATDITSSSSSRNLLYATSALINSQTCPDLQAIDMHSTVP